MASAKSFFIKQFGKDLGADIADAYSASASKDSYASKAAAVRASMSKARSMADLFISYVQEQIKMDYLRLPPKSPFTKMFEKVVGGKSPSAPVLFTAELISHLQVKRLSDGYIVEWGGKLSRPYIIGPNAQASSDALTVMKAIEAGASWPMRSSERRFIFWFIRRYKVTGKPTSSRKGWITIPPRPFFTRAAERFVSKFSKEGGLEISLKNYVLYIRIRADLSDPKVTTAVARRPKKK